MKIFKNKLFYLIAIIVIAISILSIKVYKIEPFESFSLRFNDINFDLQDKEPFKDIIFVAVDEQSVNKYGRWPWKREILAEGIDKLSQANVVLLDMIFSEHTDSMQDTVLADSIEGLNSSVCGFFLRHNSTQNISDEVLNILSDSALDLLQLQISEYKNPQFISASHAEMNIIPIMSACSLSGSFSTVRGSDYLLRSYPVSVYYKNILYPSLAVQGLRLALDADISRVDSAHVQIAEKKILLNTEGFVRLNFYEQNKYHIVSFLDVTTGKVPPSYFKGKIVILGITEVGAGDIVSTPIGSIPGPLLHYTFLSNVLSGHMIIEYELMSSFLVICMILLPLILVLSVKKIRFRFLFNVMVYAFLYVVVRYLFVVHMFYIDLFYPLVALFISYVFIEAIAFSLQEKSSQFVKHAFSSYLSQDLLNELIAKPDALSIGGESKELSILFSDIRDFTSMSESMEATKLVSILNRYFTPMTDVVIKNKGMLDKYIGDAVMAFFNAPVDVQNHPDAACRTAIEMIEKLEDLNQEFEKENIKPLCIGIGINTAEVIVGNMGSSTRFNYTVLGDGVNLAARVEGLTKKYGINILITEFTVKRMRSTFLYREIEVVKVKGKNESVLVYELMQNTSKFRKIKSSYDKALQEYKNSDFEKAKFLFEGLVKEYGDNPAKYFLKKIKREEPWGIQAFSEK